jgi:hypothetical protein
VKRSGPLGWLSADFPLNERTGADYPIFGLKNKKKY